MIKKNLKKYIFAFVILFVGIFFAALEFKSTYSISYDCSNLSSDVISDIENGNLRLTYELCGAKGDGETNDYVAIKETHDFANREYVDKGILLTVYGTEGKTYYIGDNHIDGSEKGVVIKVATNVDWQGANFIIDDYILENGSNIVDTSKYVFAVVSPMHVDNEEYLKYPKSNSNVVKSGILSKVKTATNTKDFKDVVTAIYNDVILHYGVPIMNDNVKPFFRDSQIWMIQLFNDNEKIYIRSGVNEDEGESKQEIILVDSLSGRLLNDIIFNYDEVTSFRVWPIPNNNITIKNGNFTTRTNNYAFDPETCEKKSMSYRSFDVYHTGNVSVSNIYHYLDEEINAVEMSNCEYNGIGSAYGGFMKANNAAYVDFTNIYLTPHTIPRDKLYSSFGTYDLLLNMSSNLFFDNINYTCSGNDDNTCYEDNMISTSKWGLMSSNDNKNIFITNSKMNRIDAHRGVNNLYVADTVLGVRGITFGGYGKFYGKNLTFDRTGAMSESSGVGGMVTLRTDYGSNFNGTLVLNNSRYILNDKVKKTAIIASNNAQDHYYGYDTYFPEVYVNGIDFDTSKVTESKDLYVLSLNEEAPIETSDEYRYHFKGNINLFGLKLLNNNAILNVFKDDFVNNVNNLNVNNYGGTNIVNIRYYDSDLNLANDATNLMNSAINTKFAFDSNNSSVESLVENKVSEVEDYFEELNESSRFDSITVYKSVTIPTSSSYCKSDVKYNGNSQILTKDPEEGYTFNGNNQINVGTYTITATLTSGYKWDDNTLEDKTIECSIQDADDYFRFDDNLIVKDNSNLMGILNTGITIAELKNLIETNGTIKVQNKVNIISNS